MLRRELMAVLVGVCALLSAAVVGAEDGGTTDTAPSGDVANVPTMVNQAKALMSRIEQMRQDALKAGNEAQNSQSSAAIDCTKEILRMMAGPYKLSKASHGAIVESAELPMSAQIASDIEHEYQKLATYFEQMVTLHGRLQGCGGPTGGSVIDGAPQVDKTNDMKTTTDATGGTSSNDQINDLQVSAEQSKVGSQTAIEGENP